jgi:hypothetical protein
VTAQTFGCDKEHHPLRIKNDINAPVEDRRAAAPQASSPLELLEGEGSKETSPHLLFGRFLACSLGCASPNTSPMWRLNMRGARRKDTKSVKEIHSHLNLQSPRSPIDSEGEESPKIESFEERIALFDVETPVQQWYGDIGFDYGGAASPSSSHPPPFDSPPLAHNGNDDESGKEDEDDEWSLSKNSLASFWCLMTKGEKDRLKLEGLAPYFSSSVLFEKKTDYPVL